MIDTFGGSTLHTSSPACVSAYVTVLEALEGKAANKYFFINNKGDPEKAANGDVGEYIARVVRVETPAELAAVLADVAADQSKLFSLGYVRAFAPLEGERVGPEFNVSSRKKVRPRLGLPAKIHGRGITEAEIDAAFGDVPRRLGRNSRTNLTVLRTKAFWVPGGWMLLDRDPKKEMPAHIRHIVSDDDAWLAAMTKIIPFFRAAGRVRVWSSSGRVRWEGNPMPASGSHEYIRLDQPNAVLAVSADMRTWAALRSLIWSKPAFARSGKLVSTTCTPVWDPSVFQPERLVFAGAPTLHDSRFSLGPPRIEVFDGAPLAVDDIPTPNQEDLAEEARLTGASRSSATRKPDGGKDERGRYRRTISGTVTRKTDLEWDLQLEFEQAAPATMTVREAVAQGLTEERIKVPTQFRAGSLGFNAMLFRDRDGAPLVWDRGGRETHFLSPKATAEWREKTLLPAVIPDAPPSPKRLSLDKGSAVVTQESRGFVAEALVNADRRIEYTIWSASWEKKLTPPAEFLPRPDALTMQLRKKPFGSFEMLRATTAVGKTRAYALALVEALMAAPEFRGIPRRFGCVLPNHEFADDVAKMVVEILEAMDVTGVTVSRYRGITADNPNIEDLSRPSSCELMCPFAEARLAALKAGYSSSGLCSKKRRSADGKEETIHCIRHPKNPNCQGLPCGSLSQDLTGQIVIMAGWVTFTAALHDKRLRRHVTLKTQPQWKAERQPDAFDVDAGDDAWADVAGAEAEKPSEVEIEIDPFDLIIADENDIGQLYEGIGSDTTLTEEGEEGAPLSLALSDIPNAVWPGMFGEFKDDLEGWKEPQKMTC